MTAFMSRHDIEAGALGIMRNGDIVFERGFGWKDVQRQVALPPDAMMRLASVSKPITAAAIRALVVDVLFNSRPSSGTSYSTLIRSDIDAILDAGDIPWPR